MTAPERLELNSDELQAIIAKAGSTQLSQEEVATLQAVVSTLELVTHELEKKRVSVARLRKMLFGPSSEKTDKIFGDEKNASTMESEELPLDQTGEKSANDNDAACADERRDVDRGQAADGQAADGDNKPDEKPRKGHGRNGADAYSGAENVNVSHESLSHGSRCPGCARGNVYGHIKPGVIVRIRGQAPLQATVYTLEKLRCNACGSVFSADPPPDIGEKKYDETAASINALVKYGNGMPFYRLEGLQQSLGVPLPSSTQWDIVKQAAQLVQPAFQELIRQAAQGQVLHNDDTPMKVLQLAKLIKADESSAKGGSPPRKGIFTTGLISVTEAHTIALFFTSNQHAGENLERVLEMRAKQLAPPVHMSDALTRNLPGEFETIWANCNAHARRNFVDVAHSFPDEVRYVLEVFREVYKNDADTRKHGMTPNERLLYHQEHSAPLMKGLNNWLEEQIEDKKVEPNSGLGEAITYMRKHWQKLTRFLEVPGAPLDNNVCERALKRAILHRKNALFYKTEYGALVGDIFMSLIYTACLSGANPFDYLTELQKNATALASNPEQWMPWSYRATLARVHAPAA